MKRTLQRLQNSWFVRVFLIVLLFEVGFRTEELIRKTMKDSHPYPGEKIIYVLGDSVSADYPKYLQKKIDSIYGKGKFRVISHIDYRSSLFEVKAELARAIEVYNPSAIISMFGLFDLADNRSRYYNLEFLNIENKRVKSTHHFYIYTYLKKLFYQNQTKHEVVKCDNLLNMEKMNSFIEGGEIEKFVNLYQKQDACISIEKKFQIIRALYRREAWRPTKFGKNLMNSVSAKNYKLIESKEKDLEELLSKTNEITLNARKLKYEIITLKRMNFAISVANGHYYMSEGKKSEAAALLKKVYETNVMAGYSEYFIKYLGRMNKEFTGKINVANHFGRKLAEIDEMIGYFLEKDSTGFISSTKLKFSKAIKQVLYLEMERLGDQAFTGMEKYTNFMNLIEGQNKLETILLKVVKSKHKEKVKRYIKFFPRIQNFIENKNEIPTAKIQSDYVKGYKELYKVAKEKDIPFILMQYPGYSAKSLEKEFSDEMGVVIIDNKTIFDTWVMKHGYWKFFIDIIGNNMGHFSYWGNTIVVENIMTSLMRYLPKND